MAGKILFEDLTSKIIKCFYNVHHELGGGFLESVYEKALLIELDEMHISAENQKNINVYYKEKIIGEFRADIIVSGKVLIEIKAVGILLPIHEAQLLNYLKATGIRVGFLVNFGENLEFRRKIF